MKIFPRKLFKGIDLSKNVIYLHKDNFFVTTLAQSELIHSEKVNKISNTSMISGHYLNSPEISIPSIELEGIYLE